MTNYRTTVNVIVVGQFRLFRYQRLPLLLLSFLLYTESTSARIVIFPRFDKGLRTAGLLYTCSVVSAHRPPSTQALSGHSERCSLPDRVSESEVKARKKTSTIFHPTGSQWRPGKRNFSLPAERTMPSRPANNYIVQ